MGRAKKRADRIRAEVSVLQVLADLGYHVNPNGGDREQQFSCDLHGSGRDMKPSARVYPLSSSWYCFGCGRTRDVIQTVREKEGQDFWTAVTTIEKRYSLPPLPWEDDEEEPQPQTVLDHVNENLRSDRTFEQERSRVEKLLTGLTTDREVDLMALCTFWEAFDRVCHGVAREEWPEGKGKSAMLGIRARVFVLLGIEDA